MKHRVLYLIKDLEYIDYKTFVSSIANKKRDISIIKEERFFIRILATGAPSCYANIIANIEKFDICISTDFPEFNFNDRFDNVKTVKRDNVLKYLRDFDVEQIDTFITDHIDDLPLMKISKQNLIVCPSEVLINQLKQNSISFEVMN
ncbi:hypothetical protein VOI54_09785 [Tamlana sp. 2201CG12-4]|uniref:hypothetical protein n=1 Tax=Tamlana sp. 2201CG12-4 TaxID=3112582 RepID=UPI002DB74C85|nr:hypothetical protein [Tamlana sp. 2201CG12-4]MEC3907307.1 hypothetical protein [Tamlana sp. 2201CG12-4]